VIEIVISLLQDKKILLFSKHKALLTHCCVALISFLFPFNYQHILIPILPENMTGALEAPVPYLIGIETRILTEDLEIPTDVYRVDLDNGVVSLRDNLPKVPSSHYKVLRQKLKKATDWIVRPDPYLEQVDFAFNTMFLDPDAEDDISEFEIRDAFLEFMHNIMNGY